MTLAYKRCFVDSLHVCDKCNFMRFIDLVNKFIKYYLIKRLY